MSESDINAQWREQPAPQAPAESDASADESTSELPTSELPSYPPDQPGPVERSADATLRADDPHNPNEVAASAVQDPSVPNDGATPVPGAPVLAAAAPGVPPQPSAPHFPMNYAPYPQPGPDGQVAPPVQAGPPGAGQPPIWQPQWYSPGAPPQQPPFGPAGPGQPGPFGQPSEPRRGPRVGRWLGTGVLAILLAGGGGVAGGAIVHAADSDNSGTSASSTSATRKSSTPALDRSSLAGIVAGVKDSVVSIFTQTGEGSGVVLDTNGYILTNNHVVADAQGSTVQVTFANGNSVNAKIVGTDARTDLAVVKASDASDLSPAKFGDSNALEVGDSVIAIGSPLGLDGSVTSGIVSALNRTIDESSSGDQNQNPFSQQQQQQQQSSTSIAGAIQTDAAINPGNSGGALVNMAGEVIGINTAILTGDSTSSGNIGVGFAIPSNRAKEVAQALINGQKVSHPYIGVSVATDTGNAGAKVASVVDGSPAGKGGVQQGDVITRAGDTDIHTSDDLLNVVQAAKVGDKLTLTVQRSGAQKTLTITIGESPN